MIDCWIKNCYSKDVIISGGETISSLEIEDPGFEVDLYVYTDLATLTRAWMGDIPLKQAVQSGAIELHGSKLLADGFDKWMHRSPFAQVEWPPEPLQVERILQEWTDSMGQDTALR